MLPTDMALKTDPKFKVWALKYAKDEALFFQDFKQAFEKLLALGCPKQCDVHVKSRRSEKNANDEFAEFAMHGSVKRAQELYQKGDVSVNHREESSGRTALHKSAFWGHVAMTEYLVRIGSNLGAKDFDGDTALHDAARFGHADVVNVLIRAGSQVSERNEKGETPSDLARSNGHYEVSVALDRQMRSKL